MLIHQRFTTVITSLQYALVFIPGLVTGRMFDLGYFKLPFFIASCVLVTSTFLVAQCTKYWQFLLCQGFAVGVSEGSEFQLYWLTKSCSLVVERSLDLSWALFPTGLRNDVGLLLG